MSIVSEKKVSEALSYLSIDPHPIALARKDVTDAENDMDELFAKLYRQQHEGSIKDRECAVHERDVYQRARDKVTEGMFELERHKARVKAAEMLIEVWRSENANIRAAERVR